MRDELLRRQTLTDAVEAVFRARPNQWISMHDLAKVGGEGGWRTRVSELRTKRGLTVVNNRRNGARSAYMLLLQAPLGRDVSTYIECRLPGL